MDYQKTFQKRADAYAYAVETYPHVLDHEFKTAVEMCNIQPTDIVLNIPAACVPLDQYFDVTPKRYIAYETTQSFAERVHVPHCDFFMIPEPPRSIDKIISLASLHHMSNEERGRFYKKCYDLLHDDGQLIIGDVKSHSKESRLLDEFVHTHSAGHHGLFWSEADRTLLEQHGFQVEIVLKTYPWVFDTMDAMNDFCKHLFGLDNATAEELKQGIQTYLQPVMVNGIYHVEWHLIYFIATKLPNSVPYDSNTVELRMQE
jgi:hypothetical protein